MKARFSRPVDLAAAIAVLLFSAPVCFGDAYPVFSQSNLVSDVPGLAANTDPNLVNPWGVAFVGTSPFWASDQGSGVASLYSGTGATIPLVVTVPGGTPPVSGPTGQVFNGTSSFVMPSDSQPALFLFDTLNGTIAGWNKGSGTNAATLASTPGAIYTGLTLANSGGSNYLYAADSTGSIRVFNSSFKQVSLPGGFTDPNGLTGFVPFNIQQIGSSLFVTYASLTPMGTANPGGYIDVYSTSGVFQGRFATGGALDGPWGLAMAPSGFGIFGNDLLVGNFGNGEILAYNMSGNFLGIVDGENGKPLVNDFLWSLDFRTGSGFNPDALYFTAGIGNQQKGLLGEITPAPEPADAALIFLGAVGIASILKARNRKTA